MMIWVGMCETMGIQNENKVWGMRVIDLGGAGSEIGVLGHGHVDGTSELNRIHANSQSMVNLKAGGKTVQLSSLLCVGLTCYVEFEILGGQA